MLTGRRSPVRRRAWAVGAAVWLALGPVAAAGQAAQDAYFEAAARFRQDGLAGVDRAIESFTRIIEADPDYLLAYLGAADAYLLKYEFAEEAKRDPTWLGRAHDLLSAAIARQPRVPEAYFKRAVVRFNLSQNDRAATDLEKAMELFPAYGDARLLYLQYLLSERDASEAVAFADESLALAPDDAATAKLFGDLFFREERYRDALRYYERVVGRVPRAPYTRLAMGKAYQRLDERDRAIAAFRKALGEDPDLHEARFGLGAALAEAGKLAEAAEQYRGFLEAVPADVSAMNNLALVYEQIGNTARARLMWLKVKQAAAADPSYRQRAERRLGALASPPGGEESPAVDVPRRRSP